jgi:biotin-dependent carboxylase-like uncharacterized protein
MRSIVVQSPGMFTTVQDLGREGFGPMGISASGAADAMALRIGNRLVGNLEGSAGLEMTLTGGTFQFPEGAVFALTGSDFGAALDDVPIPVWTSFEARPGQTLRLGATRGGARSYLCVQGAVLAPPFLGSSSTHVLSGLGGWEGRATRRGDVLPMGEPCERFRKRSVVSEALAYFAPRNVLRVTQGPQFDWFPEASQRSFFGSPYSVAEESNRVGIRLEGAPVVRHLTGGRQVPPGRASSEEMITEGVSLGAIQVSPGGRPIIVFVEQQTTGGYPKIANVIAADLHNVGQLRPRDEIRFERVELVMARSLLKEQEGWLASRSWLDE